MAPQSRGNKQTRKTEAQDQQAEWDSYSKGGMKFEPFVPLNDMQAELFNACLESPLVVAIGPAGVAKSFCEAAAMVRLIASQHSPITKAILTRSPVPTGHSTGFNPGTEQEKLLPWLSPILDNIKKTAKTPRGGDGFYNYLLSTGAVRMRELESIKGSSWDDTVIIGEECQEWTLEQLKNLSTRAGETSKVFLNGDVRQENERIKGSPFMRFIKAIRASNERIQAKIDAGEELEDWEIIVPVVEFRKEHCVRSGITRLMIEIFEFEGI